MARSEDQLGVSLKETADAYSRLIEVAFHTILFLRGVYPASTFVRCRSYGVPVYRCRHPEVREYISVVARQIGELLVAGNLRRAVFSLKAVASGLPLDRFIFDFGSITAPDPDAPIEKAPSEAELGLMLRGFLTRLTALDGQLDDYDGEMTYSVTLIPADGLAPAEDGNWVPAGASDSLPGNDPTPLLSVRAIETGVIDVRLLVQECVGKSGGASLRQSAFSQGE